MSYLSDGIQGRLQQAFAESDITLDVRPDYIVAKNSDNCTQEKIQQIIESAGFCPFISENKIESNFTFTIFPYKIPEFFSENQKAQSSIDTAAIEPKEHCEDKADSGIYLNVEEVARLLKHKTFIGSAESNYKDVWDEINSFRSFVSSALSHGLSEIIAKYAKDEHPIVEIGSGIGYTLSKSLSLKTIRTQPSHEECQLLSKSITDPIYKMDIEGIYKCLLESGKKVPLFFGLNVFDTLSSSARKQSFLQISQLQNTDDHILILLDTNPLIIMALEHLESLYPEHAIFPYYALTNDPAKLSVILVPLEYAQRKPSLDEFSALSDRDARAIMYRQESKTQDRLHQLQKKYNLKVIALEDVFAEQVKNELEETGYTAEIYYHASFTRGKSPEGRSSEVNQDLIYKPVTDTASVRQWCLTDEKLLNSLSKKGLHLPIHFNAEFLLNLRKKGQKMLGAEILVIAAKKV